MDTNKRYAKKKENVGKWSHVSQKSFTWIKEAFVEATVLVNPDYSTPFYIFSFASPHTIVAVML